MLRIIFISLILLLNSVFQVNSEIINDVIIKNNNRVPKATILTFGNIKMGSDYSEKDLNNILKNLYNTNFFSDIKLEVKDNVLILTVVENKIIQQIQVKGIKAKKTSKLLLEAMKLQDKSPYNEYSASQDLTLIKNILSTQGYYFAKVKSSIQENSNDTVNLIYEIELGEKALISKIEFTGDKKIKDRKLRNVITSEENRFWKFISRKKYLNPMQVDLDKRLLKNYYLSKGYYDVQILSSNVSVKEKEGIELTFSINAGKRYRLKKISTNIDPVFDKSIFKPLESEFKKYAGTYYSPFKITKILENIDEIIDDNELQFVRHSVSETIDQDFIDLEFKVFEGRKVQVERINIIGNTITNDSVIRSELLIDEGDPFSNIKVEKSISNIKSRRIFKSVNHKLIDGSSKDLKVMEITVEEKPTGEISASAGTGTEGTTIQFALSENNYLGRGLRVSSSLEASKNSIRGVLDVTDPNYNFSGNSLDYGLQSTKTDRADSGYENTLTAFHIGTRFEQYDEIFLSPGLSLAFDDLSVESSASDALKKQAGTFTDFSFNYGIEKDTRDRTFMPTSGSIFGFRQGIPIYADEQASLFNRISMNKYHGFSDDLIGAIKFYAAGVVAIEEDVRLSKRLHIPSKRLRGFESRKVGPTDAGDFVGGNYATALNLEAALPNLLPDATQTDIAAFLDIANLWHVDYDASVGQSSKIRSSVGFASNMYTPIGPLNFVIAKDLASAESDITQTFKFQIGTSF